MGARSCSHKRPVKDLEDVPEQEAPGLRTETTLAALGLFAARAYKRRAKEIAQSYKDLQAITPPERMALAIERWAAEQRAKLDGDRQALRRAVGQRYEQFAGQLNTQLQKQIAKVSGTDYRPDVTQLAAATLVASQQSRAKIDQVSKMTADQVDKRSRALVEQIENTVAAAALYATLTWPTVRTSETVRKAAAAQARAAVDVAWTFQSAAAVEAYKSAGIEYATWRTQGDSKVRPKHRALEGRVYKLSEGADGIQAGEEVNCRCYAVPKRPGYEP